MTLDDFLLSPEAEMRIAQSCQEYLEGKTTVCRTAAEALAHLESL